VAEESGELSELEPIISPAQPYHFRFAAHEFSRAKVKLRHTDLTAWGTVLLSPSLLLFYCQVVQTPATVAAINVARFSQKCDFRLLPEALALRGLNPRDQGYNYSTCPTKLASLDLREQSTP